VSTFDDHGQIDPRRGVIITCVGKKNSGKSVMGLLYFMEYPGDKIVIDVAGDDGPIGPDVITLQGNHEELPRKWPEHLRDGNNPMILRYAPDAGSDTFLEDMDAVVALALEHDRECCILIHEMGVLMESGKTPKHTRRLLMHNRHNKAVTAILCGPRRLSVNTLAFQQADLLYTFELKGHIDRARIAQDIGWGQREFSDTINALEAHEHALFDANIPKPPPGAEDTRLVVCEKLPDDVVEKVLKWSKGFRPNSKGKWS
jgi:hypothetical protein